MDTAAEDTIGWNHLGDGQFTAAARSEGPRHRQRWRAKLCLCVAEGSWSRLAMASGNQGAAESLNTDTILCALRGGPLHAKFKSGEILAGSSCNHRARSVCKGI